MLTENLPKEDRENFRSENSHLIHTVNLYSLH